MASSYILRQVCTSDLQPSPCSLDRVCCTGLCRRRSRRTRLPIFAHRWRREDLLSVPAQLRVPHRKSSVGVRAAVSTKEAKKTTENAIGSLASKFPFFKEETWADRNGGVFMDPYADPGPEFDYRVYAANTMEGFEPPPEPRIPFGGPFEDYYDKYVGLDYVPKQEKPTSSFLMFLDELNKKRAEEEAKLREKDPSRPPFDPKPNKHLFEGKKPLFTLARPVEPAPPPRAYAPPVPGEETRRLPLSWPDDEPEFVPKKKVIKVTDSLSEPLIPKSKDYDAPSSTTKSELAKQIAEKGSQNDIRGEFSPLRSVEQNASSVSPQNQVSSDIFISTSTSPDEIRPPSPQTMTYDSPHSSNVPASLQTISSEEVKASSAQYIPQSRERVLTPQLRTIQECAEGAPVSPPMSPVEATSGFCQTRPIEESQQASNEEVRNHPLIRQTRPSGATSEPPSPPTTIPTVNDLFVPHSQPSGQVQGMMPATSRAWGMETSMSAVPLTGAVENLSQAEQLFRNHPVEEANPVSQVRPMEQTFDNGTQLLSEPGPTVDGQPMFVQTRPLDGIGSLPSLGQAGHDFEVEMQKSEYYQPQVGDLVLGAVVHADTFELTLEIGAEQLGLMNIRDFQPFDQIEDGMVFGLPSSDGSMVEFVAPPIGNTLVVEDKAVNDGIYRGQLIEVGTVVLAEVQTFFNGRAVLSCKRPARILGFHRIEQLKQTGESVQIKIESFNDGGLQGYLEGVRAFLPKSELIQRLENHAALQNYVGRTLKVAIVQLEEQASNVIISEQKPWMSENLLLGSVHDLTINRIYPYGLQVEVDNTRIRGFIHISSITRSYVPSLHSLFMEGEKIRAMLIKGRRPDQPSFSIEAVEPLDSMGLVLRDRQQVFLEAEEVAKTTEEYQLPLEVRGIFALPSAPPSNLGSPTIANLPWLQLQQSKQSSS